jgi:hypothetical protein
MRAVLEPDCPIPFGGDQLGHTVESNCRAPDRQIVPSCAAPVRAHMDTFATVYG